MTERPTDLIQSVSRALRVLEVVGAAPEGCSAKVVAARTGLHLSTTYHLLRTLAYEGYLVRTDTGDYRIGLKIAGRFRDLQASLAGRPEVAEVLRLLAATTGHTAYLARFVDGRVAITVVVEAPGSPHLEDLVPGFDEGAHATALGKALLSTLPVPERHAYLVEQGMRPFTRQTIRDVGTLDAELAAATEHHPGVFVEEGQFRTPVACAAVLTEAEPTGEPMAIAVSAATLTLLRRRSELTGALRRAACDLAS